MLREGLVHLVHAAHDRSPLDGRQRRYGPHAGRSVALHAVERDAQLVLQRVDRIYEHAENPDRTGQRRAVGHDHVGRTGNVVSAAGGIGTHRHDDRFFGLQQFHLAPDHVRRQRAAAGGIDAQHHGLHSLVLAHAGQLRRQRIAVNLLSVTLAVHDLPVGIDDSHPVGSEVVQIGPDHRGVVAQRHELVVALPVVGHAQLGEDLLHLVLVDQSVHEAVFERVFGQRHLQPVGDLAHRRGVDAAGRGHRARNRAPDGIDQLLHLFAVLVRHSVENVGFHGALVPAHRGTEHLGLQVELVEQPLVEHQVHRKSRPVHAAFGLHVDPVGHRGEVVLPLRIDLVVGDDELARLPEFLQRFAQLLQQGRSGHAASAVHTQVDALDPVVGRSGFDRPQRLQQWQLPRPLQRHEVQPRQRIGRRGVGDDLRKVDPEDRLGADRDALLHRPGNAHQYENPDEKDQKRSHDEGEKPGQKGFDEIHSGFLLCGYKFFSSANITIFYEKQIKFIVFR